MNKLIPLVSIACLLPLGVTRAAPVAWDFIATSCSSPPPQTGFVGCDPAAHYPLTFASLTLSGPDSAGSAVDGVLTGDPFAFDLIAASAHPQFETFSSQEPLGPSGGRTPPYEYSLHWNEVAGELLSFSLIYITDDFGIGSNPFTAPFGLTGGSVGEDSTEIAGCGQLGCQLSGYWVDGTVSEPRSLSMMLVGLLGLIGVRYRARNSGSRSCGTIA